MKIKKLITLLLSLTVFVGCFAGCGNPGGPGGPGQHDPAKTVDILISKGGYGDKYLRDVVDQFNVTYASEGYYVNLLEPREGFGTASALAEMRLGAASGYDLVFPGSVFIYDVLDPTYGVCVEEITDVWNSTPISFDGTPESQTIRELFKADSVDAFTSLNSDGQLEYYGFPMTSSVRGVCANKALLREITGVDMDAGEYPKTTDEFIDLVEQIMRAQDDGATSAYPMAYGGSNAATYSWQSYLSTERQIMGKEEHYEWFTGDKYYLANNRSIPQNDWTRLTEAYFRAPVIEWTMNVWDNMLAAPGSDGITHDVAHGNVMLGNAVFMFDGEYFYNEVQYDYVDELADLDIFQHPIHSFVGLKYNLCGAGHQDVLTHEGSQGAHCLACDRILSAFCESWDPKAKVVSGKNVDKAAVISEVAAATGVTLTSDQYDALADARAFVYGGYSPMYMIKDCGVEEIAKLFLRMCASQDAANIRTNYGMLHPYHDNQIASDVHPFIRHCMEIDQLGISKATGNYMGRHGAPGGNFTLRYGTYTATMGVDMHAIMGAADHWSERDYVELTQELFAGDKCDVYIRNNWNSSALRVSADYVIPDIYPDYPQN